MFDRTLLALPRARIVLMLLILCSLMQAGTVIGQALALAGALSGIWAGAAVQDEAVLVAVFAACYVCRQLLLFIRDSALDRYARVRVRELRAQLLEAIFSGAAGVGSRGGCGAEGAGATGAASGRAGSGGAHGEADDARDGSATLADSAIQGIDQVESYIRILMPKMAGLVAITVPVLACTFALDWVSGVILLVLFPVIMMFMMLIGRAARTRAEKQYVSYQVLSNHFIDSLRGIRTLHVFGVGKRSAAAVYQVSERFRHATMRTLGVATLSSAVLDLIATAGVAAVAIMLGFRLLSGSLPLFTGLAVLILAPEFFVPIREFASDFHASLDGKNALAAINRIIAKGAGADGTSADESDEKGSDEKGTISIFARGSDAEGSLPKSAAGREGQRAWDAESSLELEGITFAYDGADAALSGVNLRFCGFERVGIVGASGAGKSTLVDVLGGFKKPSGGRIRWNGEELADLGVPSWRSQVIYIPQHPYIFHASLRDNIAFYCPNAPDQAVREAVAVMGLEPLVAELPAGLDTLIGEGGRTLSGGQAQRIALARAFLDPQRRIMLFDEPTAHLDVETELELKQRMLPLMEGRLVIFATHRLHWMADMDRVVVIEGGCVRAIEQESAQRAVSLVVDAAGRGPVAVAGEGAVAVGGEGAAAAGEGSAVVGEGAVASAPTSATPAAPAPTAPVAPVAPETPVAPSGRSMRWLRAYARSNRKLLAAACALGVASLACAALLMFASGYLIGRTAEPGAELLGIMMPMAFVQLFGLGKPIARYAQRLMSHDWVFRVTSDLRRRLYLAVERRAMDPQRRQTSGDYLGLLSDDIGHLQNLFLRIGMPFVVACGLTLIVVVAFGVVSPTFAPCVLAVLAVVALLIPYLTARVGRSRARCAKRMTAELYDGVTDDVLGAADWVFSGRGAEACARAERQADELGAVNARLRSDRRLAELAVRLLFGALACAVIAWAAGRFGALDAEGAPGGPANWVIAFTLAAFPLIEGYTGLPEAAQSIEGQRDAVSRLADQVLEGDGEAEADELAREAPAEPAAPAASAAPVAARSAPAGACSALVFEDVSFTYAGAAFATLSGLSLEIPTGQKVAVLGRSGAGKSTLLGLARGDLRPDAGRVLLEGMSPAAIPCIHDLVGVVAQNAFLFNQSLRQNLTLGRPGIADKEAIRALDLVGLGPLFEKLPDGLATIVGEAGARFSGGERQRIALARVLLSPAPLILFDEPTVGLDPSTEQALFDAVFATLSDRTLVVVTHHLQEADRFDRIVFVEDGRVALDGTPAELAASSPRYRQLRAFDH